MALIVCPECNNNISSLTESCPHCGFPIKRHLEDNDFNNEVSRLTSKIKEIEYSCPSPRIKVCIKCGEPFRYTRNSPEGSPTCKCNFNGKQYPGTEIDYSTGGRSVGTYGQLLYIRNQCVIPMNIGDQDSDEFKHASSKLIEAVTNSKKEFESKGKPTWMFEETPPSPNDYNNPVDWSNAAPPPNSRPQPKTNTPQCPICKSTKLKKIAIAKKAAKISVFGIFGAGDLGKTWQCENCGSKF